MPDPLIETVAAVFNVPRDQIDDHTGPGQLDRWDSVGHLDLVMAIEQRFGVQLTLDESTSLASVADIRRVLRDKGVAP
jgi:acyl carrier protein